MGFLQSVYNVIDLLFGQIFKIPEPYALIILSFIITLLITISYKYLTDQQVMKAYKERIKMLQKKMKENKDDLSKLSSMQKEAMEANFQYLGHSMKPTLITFIPIILVFGWLRQHYTNIGNPDILFGLGWLGSYIIFSLAFSLLMRKLLKVS